MLEQGNIGRSRNRWKKHLIEADEYHYHKKKKKNAEKSQESGTRDDNNKLFDSTEERGSKTKKNEHNTSIMDKCRRNMTENRNIAKRFKRKAISHSRHAFLAYLKNYDSETHFSRRRDGEDITRQRPELA
ncbi:hypothetical protein TNCV_5030521 [Trichonephila clavipes]|nr:hypothetical protein TNCV_5030521 [Trichonephila clavipes]